MWAISFLNGKVSYVVQRETSYVHTFYPKKIFKATLFVLLHCTMDSVEKWKKKKFCHLEKFRQINYSVSFVKTLLSRNFAREMWKEISVIYTPFYHWPFLILSYKYHIINSKFWKRNAYCGISECLTSKEK